MRRGIAFVIASAIAITVAGWVGAPVASAHAELDHSDPRAGSTLPSAPTQVLLVFTEDPDPTLSFVQVLDTNGTNVASGPAAAVASNPKALTVPLPADLPDGVFTVNWRTVSEQDGHVTGGAFAFGVGVAPPAGGGTEGGSAATTPPPSAASVVGKVFLYVGLAVLFAAGAMGLFAFGGTVPFRRVLLIAAWISTAVGGIVMLLAERAAVGVSMSDLLASTAGRDYVWLLVAIGVTGVSVIIAIMRPERWALALLLAAASATMLVHVRGGHASASTTMPTFEVGLQWFHFMAAGAWIGGIGLSLLLLRERRDADPPIVEVHRFSQIAGYALAVVVVTGVLRALNELGGLSAIGSILSSSYGITVALKASVVLVLIAIGAFNRYRSLPRMETDAGRLLRRMMAIELVGALGVFGLTGVLTGLPPQPSKATTPEPAAHVMASGSDFATTMKVTLTITPGTPGANGFAATVTDFDTGAPLDATGVTLTFDPVGNGSVGSSSLPMTEAGAGRWTATGTNLSLAGVWNITAVVQTGSTSASVPFTIMTRLPAQQVSVSRSPGQPDLSTFTMTNGSQLQTYIDPGKPGTDEVHVTAFDASGTELPLKAVTMTAIGPDGTAVEIPTRRFSAGHFVGDTTLAAGHWMFFVRAQARDGSVLVASFGQSI